uniref:Uncharacterized protein n=1 Tax=Salix viminalis TaxID=40686 RepID=A0A6N2M0W9_SALVM
MADKCNSVTGAIPKLNSTSLEESKFLMVILIEIATLSFHPLPLVFGYGCWFHESFHCLIVGKGIELQLRWKFPIPSSNSPGNLIRSPKRRPRNKLHTVNSTISCT